MTLLRGTLLSAVGCAIGLSAGLWYGESALTSFRYELADELVEVVDDAYIVGRQSVAIECMTAGFAILPETENMPEPAVLVCADAQLSVIPEEDREELKDRMEPEYETKTLQQSI